MSTHSIYPIKNRSGSWRIRKCWKRFRLMSCLTALARTLNANNNSPKSNMLDLICIQITGHAVILRRPAKQWSRCESGSVYMLHQHQHACVQIACVRRGCLQLQSCCVDVRKTIRFHPVIICNACIINIVCSKYHIIQSTRNPNISKQSFSC